MEEAQPGTSAKKKNKKKQKKKKRLILLTDPTNVKFALVLFKW